jgi:ATP-binding cassette subfamily C protein CydC
LQAQCTAIAAADHRLSKADDILNRIESGVTVGFGLASAALLSGTLLTVTSLAERGIIGAPVAACGLLMALAALEPFAVLRRGALELGRTMLAARRLSPRLVQVSHSPAHQMPPDGLPSVSPAFPPDMRERQWLRLKTSRFRWRWASIWR